MVQINELPIEALHKIISYLDHDFPTLITCSLVCGALWNVATAALYHSVDLNIGGNDEWTLLRQLRLIRSLAENPTLGSHVRFFKNERDQHYDDVISQAGVDKSFLVSAAKNMVHLTRAKLAPNHLTAHIVANLQAYPRLSDLTIFHLCPDEHVWRNAPTSLRRLNWTIPVDRDFDESWEPVSFLHLVVEATCPDMEAFDVVINREHGAEQNLEMVDESIIQQYRNLPIVADSKLRRLGHLGLLHQTISNPILRCISTHRMSLTSITLPISWVIWEKETLDSILQVCDILPNLKELNLKELKLDNVESYNKPSTNITAVEFFASLTTSPSTRNIESFSCSSILAYFCPQIGRLFHSWPALIFLHIGDGDNEGGPFGQDGRLQFYDYAPYILGFIESLPHSVQKLYLEINGESLLDNDSDFIQFDSMCDLGPEIFKSKTRLHTCDIHAWITNRDGGLETTPEKAVFYRRLPAPASPGKDANDEGRGKKAIWTSRMSCVYQGDKRDLSVDMEICEGNWEGDDAAGSWEDELQVIGSSGSRTGRGIGAMRPAQVDVDRRWPFFYDEVAEYEMFADKGR